MDIASAVIRDTPKPLSDVGSALAVSADGAVMATGETDPRRARPVHRRQPEVFSGWEVDRLRLPSRPRPGGHLRHVRRRRTSQEPEQPSCNRHRAHMVARRPVHLLSLRPQRLEPGLEDARRRQRSPSHHTRRGLHRVRIHDRTAIFYSKTDGGMAACGLPDETAATSGCSSRPSFATTSPPAVRACTSPPHAARAGGRRFSSTDSGSDDRAPCCACRAPSDSVSALRPTNPGSSFLSSTALVQT